MEYCGNINNSCWEVAAIKGWHTHNTQRKLQEFPWEAEKNFLQLRAELKRHNNGNSHALHQLYYSFAEGKTRQLFLCALTRLSLISLFSLCSTDTNILQEIIDRLSLAAREYPSIPRLIQPTVFPAYYSSIHMKPTQRAQAFGAVCFDKFLFHLFFLVHAAEWQQKLRQWENETRRKEIDRRCNWEMCEVVAVRMSCLVLCDQLAIERIKQTACEMCANFLASCQHDWTYHRQSRSQTKCGSTSFCTLSSYSHF